MHVAYFRHHESSPKQVDDLHREFSGAIPFPHVVLSDFVLHQPTEVLNSFPAIDWSGWQRYQDDYQRGKMICRDVEVMPPRLVDMIHELCAPSFLEFLEKVTGIEALLPDPYLEGGGLHCSGAGGILAPHTDFHVYPRLNLYRQINVLVYLNQEWEEEWGGCLELYTKGQEKPERVVVPNWGTCVIFKTDDSSVHGFSRPIVGDRWRRSIALYYYTSTETEGFSGDRNTYWTQHRTFGGLKRLRFALNRTLLFGSRGLAVMAHRVNPSLGSRRKPK